MDSQISRFHKGKKTGTSRPRDTDTYCRPYARVLELSRGGSAGERKHAGAGDECIPRSFQECTEYPNRGAVERARSEKANAAFSPAEPRRGFRLAFNIAPAVQAHGLAHVRLWAQARRVPVARVKDINFDDKTVEVCSGKGGKDRLMVPPLVLIQDRRAYLQELHKQREEMQRRDLMDTTFVRFRNCSAIRACGRR